MKVEQPKEIEGSICSFFTTFAGFTNSTPASLFLIVQQNNDTMKQSEEVFCKKGVLRNFVKFTGMQPY